MTILSILAVLGGLGTLMFVPVFKDRLRRLSSQGVGGLLFATGLIGLIYTLLSPTVT